MRKINHTFAQPRKFIAFKWKEGREGEKCINSTLGEGKSNNSEYQVTVMKCGADIAE